jgi:hypothetical protein
MDQTALLSIMQVDNNLKNLTKLDLLKNKLWLISYELTDREISLEYQFNPQIFSAIQKNMRSSALERSSRTQSNKVGFSTKLKYYCRW